MLKPRSKAFIQGEDYCRPWEFWIDVGGTFTDCLAKCPDGSVLSYKLLSSGIIKGRVGEGSSGICIRDSERKKDPPRFFEGYTLVLYREKSSEEGEGSCHSPVEMLESVKVSAFDRDTGSLTLAKQLSAVPEKGMLYELFSGEEAPLTGIRWLKGLRLDEKVGSVSVRLGTTRGTNALLEKQGANVAFVTTRGFGDILRIGYQNRPRLFALKVEKPLELYQDVVELDERIDNEGVIITPLQEKEAAKKLAPLLEKGIDSLAVCLMNSYRNNRHERMVAHIAQRLGFSHISCSSDLVPLQKIVARGETTVIDAYLTPVIKGYLQEIRTGLPGSPLKLMTNTGGLVDAKVYAGKDSILSGPAGGVVGYAKVARQAGFPLAIGFDMGGTSTDISRFHGDFEFRFEMEINDPESHGGVHLISPMLRIETVAAGGGSVCWFDGQFPRVGPLSAGADPGPACYGRGGPLTITDINLYLGRLLPNFFAFPLNLKAVIRHLDEIRSAMAQKGQHYTREELAEGFSRIADSAIAAAIKKISVARGYDVRDYILAAFGGAGPQHACSVARELGIEKILIHPYGSVLSAYGIGMADVEKFGEHAVGRLYGPEALEELESLFRSMETSLHMDILDEGVHKERILPPRRMLDLRYQGQESTITVSRPPDGDYQKAFEEQHRLYYGFTCPGREIEICVARVEMVGETEKNEPVPAKIHMRRPSPGGKTRLYATGGWYEAGAFKRESLSPGDVIDGPAIIIEEGTTIVVEPQWEAQVTGLNNILLQDTIAGECKNAGECKDLPNEKLAPREKSEEVDLVTLELFNNTFSSIAEQMGATLQKTALSTNVKERLDFSCAIFTAEGELVANAPHIPVHLGAMPASVKFIRETFPQMRPGEIYITNDPFHGGSHLPDVTVVTPVFDEEGKELLFFTANRAHHAEIGGITPGSMPPFAKNLAEEGVLLKAFPFVSNDRAGEERLISLLEESKYPTRALRDNLADINAQVAANQTGAFRLLELVGRYGLEVVRAYMGHIQDAAEKMMRQALLKISPGEYFFEDYLDNGSPLSVKIIIRHLYKDGNYGGEAVVDFHGTGKVVESSLNANRAIVTSAVLYCFRCLINKEIPLNAGVLKPISIILPANCLLNPPASDDAEKCAAVAGGNVETSQRVVDVVFGALKIMAAGQGTMNNVSFGRRGEGGEPVLAYYETIAGGAGAGEGFHGASAVHTHMTNTRITDPEVVEARYPVRINRFAVRKGSGGKGRYRGGDGIIREMEFLEPLQVSLLTGRRKYAPYGLAGGEPGKKGKNILCRRGSSRKEELPWAAMFSADPGDILIIETPGGGGYGKPAGRA